MGEFCAGFCYNEISSLHLTFITRVRFHKANLGRVWVITNGGRQEKNIRH